MISAVQQEQDHKQYNSVNFVASRQSSQENQDNGSNLMVISYLNSQERNSESMQLQNNGAKGYNKGFIPTSILSTDKHTCHSPDNNNKRPVASVVKRAADLKESVSESV